MNTSELAVAGGLPPEAPLVEVVTGARLGAAASLPVLSGRAGCRRLAGVVGGLEACSVRCLCTLRCLLHRTGYSPSSPPRSLAAEGPGTYIGRGPPTATEVLGGRRRGPDVSSSPALVAWLKLAAPCSWMKPLSLLGAVRFGQHRQSVPRCTLRPSAPALPHACRSRRATRCPSRWTT